MPNYVSFSAMKKIFPILYLICAVGFIISTQFTPFPFSWLIKIIPVCILIVYACSQFIHSISKPFIAGLACSAVGDFFLEYDSINYFIFGLGSFFIAHLCYLFTLKPIEKKYESAIGLYLIYGALIFWIIADGLGELFIPVLAYILVLLTMAIFTLLSKKSNPWLITGGICFALSDSLLGINKFYQPIPFADLLIMSSYYFAQFALFKGFTSTTVIRNRCSA